MAVISRNSLREVSIDELRTAAEEAREDIWKAAKRCGREPKVYMHWTAGHYETFFDDYHVSIDDAGRIYLNGSLSDILAHTYHRNSGRDHAQCLRRSYEQRSWRRGPDGGAD